jgi:hypothetical protein
MYNTLLGLVVTAAVVIAVVSALTLIVALTWKFATYIGNVLDLDWAWPW